MVVKAARRSKDLDRLLEETSRTFALAIPLLPSETRRAVTVAYLLFRIADTFEDAASWSKEARVAALDDFVDVLDRGDVAAAAHLGEAWARARPIEHEGYLELLRSTDRALEALGALREPLRDEIRRHTERTARRMAGFVERTGADGVLRLDTLAELRDYCYAVAGIVGEMLTELFLLDCTGLAGSAEELRGKAPLFGEALQLVNILRDSSADGREGRSYLPASVAREDLFSLARSDLHTAREYTALLREGGAHPGVVAFTTLPTELAFATLDEVAARGPGAKVSRALVARILASLQPLRLGSV